MNKTKVWGKWLIYKYTVNYFFFPLQCPIITSSFPIVLSPSTVATLMYQYELLSILLVPDSYNKITSQCFFPPISLYVFLQRFQ